METLYHILSEHLFVSDALKKELEKRISLQTFKKKEIVLHANQVCTNYYFIEKGIMRLYFSKGEKEITDFFSSENQWISSARSFLKQEIDYYTIDAIEETTVWTLSIDDYTYLSSTYPELDCYFKTEILNLFSTTLDHLASTRFSTAKEKHDTFLKTYATIYHRIPLRIVASHLGITQETLSRLRKEKYAYK